jgi:hypothetical protein
MSTGRLGAGDTAIQPTIFDAKADLLTATAADTPARLAVGSNDTVLTADSSTATGLKWAAAASSNKTYTLLNTGGTALSGSSSVQVNVSTKEDYYILVTGASCGSTSQSMSLRINADSGSNYLRFYTEVNAESPFTSNFVNTASATTTSIGVLALMSGNAGSVMNAGVYVGAGNSTTIHPFTFAGGGTPSGSNNQSLFSGGGVYTGTAAITSFTLFSGANFDAGTIYIYGA